jgi:hypothetical protein
LKKSFELPVQDLWIKNTSTDEKDWGKFIRKWDADIVLSVAKDDNGNGCSPVVNAALTNLHMAACFGGEERQLRVLV